jgi:hypothetical protein
MKRTMACGIGKVTTGNRVTKQQALQQRWPRQFADRCGIA